jgi:multidrug transporter EmrE-like cation transporter
MCLQASLAGALPGGLLGKAYFVGYLFLYPWIITSFIATLFAGVSWILVMSRLEINYAYSWISLNFLLMLFIGVVLFDGSFSLVRLIGTLLVVVGIIVLAGN